VFAQVEGPLFALLTVVKVDGGYDKLISLGLGLRYYVTLGVDDHATGDEMMDVVVPSCSRRGYAEHCKSVSYGGLEGNSQGGTISACALNTTYMSSCMLRLGPLLIVSADTSKLSQNS
jgi:hypothetical protein